MMKNNPTEKLSPPSFMRLRSLLPALILLCLGTVVACETSNEPEEKQERPECGPESLNQSPCPIEIAGTWDSEWGSIHEIDNNFWDDSEVVSYDNELRAATVKLPENDAWNPGKFSRIAWTPGSEGTFWTCISSFGNDTAEEAEEAELPDASNPAESGCSDFPWDRLSPREPIELKGSWTSDWADETISSRRWEWVEMVDYDNAERVAIVRNPDDAEFAPGTFGKRVWTPVEDGAFFYCDVVFGEESANDARNAEAEFDDSDPENGGCSDFPWTRLERQSEGN